MSIQLKVTINGTAEAIWKVITDIDNAAETISGINKIEVLDRPDSGVVGLKWKEERTMFGKQATETMWIIEAVENVSYTTRAESHGCVFITSFTIEKTGEGCSLAMNHQTKPQKLMAKIMSPIMGLFFKGAIKKVILQDLNDIKKKVESTTED